MKKTAVLVRAAVIAAMYAALTLLTYTFSYGNIQFRISEALTVLPLFYFEAVPGLMIGCFLANIASTPMDMLIGPIATLIAALLTWILRKWYFGIWPPILVNALMVPVIFLSMPEMPVYWINVLTVGAGQVLSVFALGLPLYFAYRPLYRKYAFLQPYVFARKKPAKQG